MNYKKIHDAIINRAKTRVVEGYVEEHHIIPKSMGGTDDSSNIVNLTPEEHFLIHILLMKIYPDNHNLIYAVKLMCEHNTTNRMSNKLYGWLKRRHSEASSIKFKTMWSNPKKRAQIINSMIVSFNTPEHKKQKSEMMKREWQNNRDKRLSQIQKLQKEYNKHTANIVRDKWKNDEEYKLKMRNRKPRGPDGSKMKAKWSDPVWREKMLLQRKLAKERKRQNETNKSN